MRSIFTDIDIVSGEFVDTEGSLYIHADSYQTLVVTLRARNRHTRSWQINNPKSGS
jgi:hypothetical protein